MKYLSRYTYWLYTANVNKKDLPPDLANLIQHYEQALAAWQKAKESEQNDYLKIVEYTDAIISAKIYRLYENKINDEGARLQDLISKAAELDF